MKEQEIEPKQLISLSTLIETIKDDLLENPSKNSLFYIEGIEITAEVITTKSHTVEGKLDVSILSFGVNGNIDRHVEKEQTQLVKIKLAPLLSKEEFLKNLPNEEKKDLFNLTRKTTYRNGGDF